ncbi:MAG: hypothetical protein EHM75_04920 [Desulfobacteraceae bacterium]|nr:MAG: hypothetical protein EHM75_04920 [Desulfobacteraceae bacterium]
MGRIIRKSVTIRRLFPDRRPYQVDYILKKINIGTLQRTHWHLVKTCALLGISRPTLRQKLKTYGLVRDL